MRQRWQGLEISWMRPSLVLLFNLETFATGDRPGSEANVRNKERSGGKPLGLRKGGGTLGWRWHLVPAVNNKVAVRS